MSAFILYQVDHPYSSLIRYAKCLKGDKAKLQKMVQMSWTFVNDSLCTTLCLQVTLFLTKILIYSSVHAIELVKLLNYLLAEIDRVGV